MNDEGGKKFLANKYGVKSSQDVMKWANAFKSFGEEETSLCLHILTTKFLKNNEPFSCITVSSYC